MLPRILSFSPTAIFLYSDSPARQLESKVTKRQVHLTLDLASARPSHDTEYRSFGGSCLCIKMKSMGIA